MDLSTIQIPLNEDEVPMDEKDVEHIWQDYAKSAGLYATHIENVNTPMPDTILIWKGITFYHEIKLRRGNLIYFQHYQWSNLIRMRHFLHPWQLNIVAWKDHVFSLYSIDQVKEAGVDTAGHGKVKANIAALEPLITVSNAYEFDLYLEWVRSKAWKKKS